MSFQGKEFTLEMRQMIVNVKLFFDKMKNNNKTLVLPASKLAANALGISESTVKLTMANFNKYGEEGLKISNFKQRGRPAYAVDSSIAGPVRKFIRDANKNGEQVSIKIIRNFLSDKFHLEVAHSTLWRTLKRWGFEFGTGVRSAQLKESERIVKMRREYLQQKRANRDDNGQEIRSEVYLDESYINKNHSNDNTWYFPEDGLIIGKPTGKGERLIIVNAITKDGWVPNAKLVFKASKAGGDYHTNMNWNNFSRWFKEKLLKNIPKNSLIIMDNAAYHNVLAEGEYPKKSHSIKRLREWLSNNEITWSKDMSKSKIFELCSLHATKPEFLIDKIARDNGHTILRTPPYHPELQPIETCWAIVKNHVAQNNDCTMAKVKTLLEEGFEKVTEKTCQKLIQKVKLQEDIFWIEDNETSK